MSARERLAATEQRLTALLQAYCDSHREYWSVPPGSYRNPNVQPVELANWLLAHGVTLGALAPKANAPEGQASVPRGEIHVRQGARTVGKIVGVDAAPAPTALWRKKPVTVEVSEPLTTENAARIADWAAQSEVTDFGLFIRTLEGTHHASWGDRVIKGVQGEFYPCKPDIFAATYEPAAAPPAGGKETK